jgi:hypothetical protein
MSVLSVQITEDEFSATVTAGQKIHAVSSLRSTVIFGCYQGSHGQPPLYMKQDGQPIAEPMPVCPDIYTVRSQCLKQVIDALPDKVFRVTDPHKDDTIALVQKKYKIGTEKKGESWVLWGFPAGKTLNVHGLPKSIAQGVPQY